MLQALKKEALDAAKEFTKALLENEKYFDEGKDDASSILGPGLW